MAGTSSSATVLVVWAVLAIDSAASSSPWEDTGGDAAGATASMSSNGAPFDDRGDAPSGGVCPSGGTIGGSRLSAAHPVVFYESSWDCVW